MRHKEWKVLGISEEKMDQLRKIIEDGAESGSEVIFNDAKKQIVVIMESLGRMAEVSDPKLAEAVVNIFTATFVAQLCSCVLGRMCALQLNLANAKDNEQIKAVLKGFRAHMNSVLIDENFMLVPDPGSRVH